MNLLDVAEWEALSSPPGAAESPEDLPDDGWMPARVPGTAAEVLRVNGRAPVTGEELDGCDWWWRTVIDVAHCPAGWLLTVEGLATVADVWLAGTHVLHSENMFRSHAVELAALPRTVTVEIRCRAALPLVTARRPRPRWKSSLVTQQGWRWLRTSLLGRAPAWAGSAPPVGPWRAVSLRAVDRPYVVSHHLSAQLDGDEGVVAVEAGLVAPEPARRATVYVGDAFAEASLADGALRARVRVPRVRPWWPHTHGLPYRYPVSVVVDGYEVRLRDIGFRNVTVDRSTGGFQLRFNGVPLFARGACWMPPDPVSLRADTAQLRATIELARDAGFNMLRVVGGTLYETDTFYDLCTEVGMLVWQDVMLATLDPPDDDGFLAELAAEVTQLVERVSGRPCLAVLSGGSETEQQPALLGIQRDRSAVTAVDTLIPELLRQRVLEVPYVPSTPTGGVLPTDVSSGVAHYYGVGAYLRPLSEVRTAGVRFAAECLALSIPPEAPGVERWFGSAAVAGHHPAWKAGVPRDRGASWDFEDVRDHYVRQVFDVDPMLVRMEDPQRYLDLGRAVTCVLMTEAFARWRRPTSGCAGALVWTLRDLAPGAGWGLTDSGGAPKAPWYALRRVLAPVSVLVSDDGLNGLVVIACNDTKVAIAARLEIRLWSVSGVPLESVSTQVVVPAREGMEIRLDEVVGHFTDAGHVYRFGPRIWDVLRVRLIGADGLVLAEQVALLGEHLRPAYDGGLNAVVQRTDDGWQVDIAATRLAQWVAITCADYQPTESWFHLAPGTERRVRLDPVRSGAGRPIVRVRAMNVPETAAAYGCSASEDELEECG
ncbi:glycosyl hydrolase 2 galactose-binding domain-containing protein [Verrucosispora sp. TAA-831]|uniref:glycosyl hydrolase 2 galactose-binding domain-containing protein n=1 Tax=Verrucosispora sp. TAA-831 TaxID=3422227 RepID=UPI003D6F716C